MANTKEVRKQIASIKSTQKITSAMEMVAASKIKKTQSTRIYRLAPVHPAAGIYLPAAVQPRHTINIGMHISTAPAVYAGNF